MGLDGVWALALGSAALRIAKLGSVLKVHKRLEPARAATIKDDIPHLRMASWSFIDDKKLVNQD